MSRFKRHSLTALALLAALGFSVDTGHASQFQRVYAFGRATANTQVGSVGKQQNTSAIMNSINTKKTIAAGVSPDG